MKRLILFIFLFPVLAFAQVNDYSNTNQKGTLRIENNLLLDNASAPDSAGALKYDGSIFSGYNGRAWLTLIDTNDVDYFAGTDNNKILNALSNLTYLKIGRNYNLSASLIIPAGKTIEFLPGGKLTLSSGTITFDSTEIINPDNHNIIDSRITVAGSGHSKLLNRSWYGYDNYIDYGVEIPDSFTHTMGPFNITKDPQGRATINSPTIESFRKDEALMTVVRYVDAVNGSGANGGTSWADAYDDLEDATDDSPNRIYIQGGYAYAEINDNLPNDCEIISIGGPALVGGGWTPENLSGGTISGGVWYRDLTVAVEVYDITHVDEWGDLIPYVEAVDSATCVSTPGTKYQGVENLVIHPVSESLDNQLLISRYYLTPGTVISDEFYYFENIILPRGISLASNDADLITAAFKNCQFIDGDANEDLVNITGSVNIWLENCIASKAGNDVLNYHNSTIYTPYAVEYNTTARFAGEDPGATDVNNASTAHELAQVLRVNGAYHSTDGPTVHDVQSAKSLNINCIAYDSYPATDATRAVAFCTGSSSDNTIINKMWLNGCKTINKTGMFGTAKILNGTGFMYLKDCDIFNVQDFTDVTVY